MTKRVPAKDRIGKRFGRLLVVNVTGNGVREQAIEAGVDEWTIDPKTGDKEFKWKKVDCGEVKL